MTPPRRIFTHRITDDGSDSPSVAGSEIFPYWSFTKTALAICALRMVEQGLLSLDMPLAGYDFSLRQLLNHTSGLPDYGALPAYREAVARNEEPWPATRLLEVAMAQGRLFGPGAGWAYSNVGYLLVRDLTEQASGRSFAQNIKLLICDPLGLGSIALASSRQQFGRVLWDGAQSYHPGWVYHGCLTGTAADAARLLHGLFAGRLLGPEMLAQMCQCQPLGGALPGRPWTECGYGLGVMSGSWGAAGRVIGHTGGGPFSVNAVYHFPDMAQPLTVASFTDGQEEGIAEHAAAARAHPA